MAVVNMLVTLMRFAIGFNIGMITNKSRIACLYIIQNFKEVSRPINRQA